MIDKPYGITSSDVVNRVKKILKIAKAGHTGTLDKFATGVLPVCAGEATKTVPYLEESFKEYEATMRLGAGTDTLDLTGRIVSTGDIGKISQDDILSCFGENTGTFFQVPPMFSAVKKNGVRLSKIARLGGEVERRAKRVNVEELDLIEFSPPLVRFSVKCSRGTYVRTLASEMGKRLGCMAHLVQLRRLCSGRFLISESANFEELEAGSFKLTGINDALSHLKSLVLGKEAADIARNGGAIRGEHLRGRRIPYFGSGETVKLTHNGAVVSVAETLADSGEVDRLKDKPVIRQLRVFGLH